ncbi:hypothetical protein N0V90_005153 [Kalmusia sp. IMI 367209]|nr:hypothetical protein N0V90_005153 [Kalmusia sp. IMI 367209]
MSCWRVLELSDEDLDQSTPQLLIKPQFGSSAYTVFLTDLSNIWSEEVDLFDIVRRASEVESPIEVSEQDTAQLAILFENVQKSLDHNDDTSCAVTRTESDGIILHTSISLPEPLDSLTWKFYLRKRTASMLKDELILPLLVSSHIQHERIAGLLSVISDKDRALTRLIDQYESSNLDLAAAFPSIGNVKSGRRIIKREQAARHIPGLQNFDRGVWRKETAELVNTNVSTLGLFQEALSECTPKIPQKLKSGDEVTPWWKSLDTSTSIHKRALTAKAKAQSKKAVTPARAIAHESETDDEETEDEFETHENFKTRNLATKPEPVEKLSTALGKEQQEVGAGGTKNDEDMHENQDDDDDDDEDLDAPPKNQSQSHRAPPQAKSSMSERSATETKSSPNLENPPPEKPKGRGFKIGGKLRKTESPPAEPQEEPSIATTDSDGIPMRSKDDADGVGTKAVKRGFKIGGKPKAQTAMTAGEATTSNRASRETSEITQHPSVEPSASIPTRTGKQAVPVEEAREETAEEKAERKRRELKRKNEELTKKQAQSKKKKRF